MSGHTLPPTGSRPCTLNSAKVLWVQKRSVKQRGRAAGGHRLVFEPNMCVTACVTLYLSVTYAQGNTSTSLDFMAPEQQSAVFPLTSPQQRLHFASFTCMTWKHERIAYVPLWREANPAEKRHLYLFAIKPNPNAFKCIVRVFLTQSLT